MAGFKLEVPVDLSEKTTSIIDTAKKILHLVTLLTTVLTICIVVPMLVTEVRYLDGGKPAPNYTLFVAIISLPIPFFLVYFPWMYEHHNKFRRPGKFCLKNRTNLIFCGFNSFLWATAGIATAVYANDASACTVDPDIQEAYGDSYVSAWGTQCNLAKVAAAFAWITCIIWLSTLLCTLISFWREKQDIQNRLKEHRMSKQSKLEQEGSVEQGYARPTYQEEEPTHHQHESSPLNNPVHYEQPHYQHSSPYEGGNMGQYQHSPYDASQYPSNQYHTSPPTQFSPMPTPQHVMPHPDQVHYNNNPNF
ncbi:hypothetical protein G6F46_000517 [Rhizopus delemar]|uniref:MARVEL domain-containing protein n=2 Tax=Rhizopus TaxID=4842 RepID=A0A9P6ZCT9_9FUNG|nr:hypothetical protein G6F43_009284 [Rhizopus delemar]KAG1554230.1 hypothetical protein G6F51_000095 [Rhizopus arrhizus]KAG1466875.1 hypothetical protein G6F55_000199 [Rhizopus delemar]KAG1504669.1 hypothetical protein G6F54_000844 [Rhizopus delemar]KAG1518866.1 hypothetical protein G6F53_000241 [Rhizopus delemar]